MDYQQLNDVTKKDCFPIPWINNTLDTLARTKWISMLNLKKSYWQVALHLSGKEKMRSFPDRICGSSHSCPLDFAALGNDQTHNGF
jgi:hypothetical protein